MVSYLTIGALAAGAIAVVMLLMSVMVSRKATPSDDERKKAGTYQMIALVLFLLSLGLTAAMAFYPALGQRYQTGSRGAAPRPTV
jgi:cytosine/uracil/thiamine/allantoin permease